METEINLKLILGALKKNIIWIIAITLVCTVAAGVVTFFTPPTYSSSAKYISTNNKEGDSFAQSAIVSAQQQLVNDYIEIIGSEEMMGPVSEKLKEKGINYSPEALEKMITGQQINETSAFIITVKSSSPEHARAIIETISENVSNVIDGVQKRENTVAVLDPVTEPKKTGPNLVRNAVLACGISFIMSIVAFSVVAFYDRTVRSEDDLKKRFDLPVIGVIPEWKS